MAGGTRPGVMIPEGWPGAGGPVRAATKRRQTGQRRAVRIVLAELGCSSHIGFHKMHTTLIVGKHKHIESHNYLLPTALTQPIRPLRPLLHILHNDLHSTALIRPICLTLNTLPPTPFTTIFCPKLIAILHSYLLPSALTHPIMPLTLHPTSFTAAGSPLL